LKQGDDDVSLCRHDQKSIGHYYNFAPTLPRPVLASDLSVGFSNMRVNYENGLVRCSFNRKKNMPNVNDYFDLAGDTYYLLVAYGPTADSN
jgi:hypothetical protein